jgi:hypothetical protein
MKQFKGPKRQRGFLGILALGLSAVSTAISYKEGKKAQKKGRAANEAQKKVNRLRNYQKKRGFLRNFRAQQANIYSETIARGVGLESSGAQGQLASQGTQSTTAVREARQLGDLGAEVADFQQGQANANFRSQRASAIGSFASQFISLSKPASPVDPEVRQVTDKGGPI